jgi:uncharacterized protein (DUF924 family)
MLTGSDERDGGPLSSGRLSGRGLDHANAIVEYWFAPGNEERWFEPDPDFDAEIERRFREAVADAAAGRLAHWQATPEGALALCLLLDQFPRNIWRGTVRAFSCDAMAREAARAALAAGNDRQLPPRQRPFLYLPFEHSEDLADQERCVALMRTLDNPEQLDWAQRHRDVIARFGRFPHRNAILGRNGTPEEAEFLQQPGWSF